MDKQRILVVDDEEALTNVVRFNLEVEGYDVDTAFSAEEALKLDIESYDLILLDVMMGGISGFKMAQILKENYETFSIPIIFCTAKTTEDEMVAGLNLGADDYITKPYSIRNLLARVKSVLRRTSRNREERPRKSDTLDFEGLHIDCDAKRLTVDGTDVQITRKELELLILLMNNMGKILSREEILSRIWDDEVFVLNRTIDVKITRLRKKMGPYGKHIVTRFGYGYGFEK